MEKTPARQEIIDLADSGLTRKQIAAKLEVTFAYVVSTLQNLGHHLTSEESRKRKAKVAPEIKQKATEMYFSGKYTMQQISDETGITGETVRQAVKLVPGGQERLRERFPSTGSPLRFGGATGRNPNCRFTAEQELEIIAMRKAGVTILDIAEKFETTRPSIKMFLRRHGVTVDAEIAQKNIRAARVSFGPDHYAKMRAAAAKSKDESDANSTTKV